MAVGEDHRGSTSSGALELGDEAVASGDDLMEAFAAGAAVVEQVPTRMPFLDLCRRETLVLA